EILRRLERKIDQSDEVSLIKAPNGTFRKRQLNLCAVTTAQKFITASINDPTETHSEHAEFNGWTTSLMNCR
ncbi:MAG: hypothetical protein R6X27_18780, partial [Candidatus Desulfacyla sp.]